MFLCFHQKIEQNIHNEQQIFDKLAKHDVTDGIHQSLQTIINHNGKLSQIMKARQDRKYLYRVFIF